MLQIAAGFGKGSTNQSTQSFQYYAQQGGDIRIDRKVIESEVGCGQLSIESILREILIRQVEILEA